MRIHPGVVLIGLLVVGCDSSSPDGECGELFFRDADGDGYGDDGDTAQGCEPPAGYIAAGDDCDDDDAAAHPGGREICDGADNDCNGLSDSADPAIDLSTVREYYRDADGDGHGDPADAVESCDRPAGRVNEATDCDDSDAAVHPDASEVCDLIDNDCDDLVDTNDDSLDMSTAETYYLDTDGDGFGVGAGVVSCEPPAQHATASGDCNDSASDVHPGAIERCDAEDNDCDGGIDGTPGAQNQCGGLVGLYDGTYQISATEKLGATIINQMICTGTSAMEVKLSQSPALQGTLRCTYPGGLVAFNSTQNGTIRADVALDGSITGMITHGYASGLSRTYSFTGTIAGGTLQINGTSTLLPHPMSVVPWEVVYAVSAN